MELSEQQLQRILDCALADHNVVGASLAISHSGSNYSVAAGLLNNATGARVTTDSPFQIGSVTKVMTATLIMQLVEQGHIDLDQPVRTWLPEFSAADPHVVAAITLRHLLSHTAGLSDGPLSSDTDEQTKLADYLSNELNPPLRFASPGVIHSYSNQGFAIAGRVVEHIIGKDWDTILEERILTPLGLNSAFTSPPTQRPSTAALGHMPDVEHPGQHQLIADEPIPRHMAPAGATCYMKATELLYFVENSDRLLTNKALKTMQTPQIELHPYSPRNTTHWGLGWSLVDHPEHQILSHDGTTPGQAAYLRYLPEPGFGIALLTNSLSISLWDDLFPRLLFDLTGIELPIHSAGVELLDNPSRFVGIYATSGSRVEVTCNDHRLHVSATDGTGGPVLLEGDLLPFSHDSFDMKMADGSTLGEVSFVGNDTTGQAKFLSFSFRSIPRQTEHIDS
jgi:CubicO group peptidase (beta-lactamase class C family)